METPEYVWFVPMAHLAICEAISAKRGTGFYSFQITSPLILRELRPSVISQGICARASCKQSGSVLLLLRYF